MATHSSVLAWRIQGTGEPGGLPSMRSHRVGHNWSDLAAAAATVPITLDINGNFTHITYFVLKSHTHYHATWQTHNILVKQINKNDGNRFYIWKKQKESEVIHKSWLPFLSLSAKKLSPLVGFPFMEIYCELCFLFKWAYFFPFNYFYDMCWVSNKRELWNDKHKHEKCRV